MITDRETNKVFLSEILKSDKRFSETSIEIINILNACQVDYEFLTRTKDIWARDYMPIQVSDNKFIEFRYDPDYLQGEENRIYKTYPDIVCDSIGLKTIKSDIIIDGGNVIKSTNCAILTDKILLENEGTYEPDQLKEKLKLLFEVEKIILVPWDKKNDFYGHADGMIRFIDENKVLIQGYFDFYSKKFTDEFFGALEENGIEWIKLEFDRKKEDMRSWAYLNFLQTKDLILMPKFGIIEDELALNQFKSIFKNYADSDRIFQLDMNTIVEEGGALNCISWTIKQ